MAVDQTPRVSFPYPGSRDDGMTDRQLGDLSRALLLFRVSVMVGRQDGDIDRYSVALPVSVSFDGLTDPMHLGMETANVLAEGNRLVEQISGAIAQLRLQIDNTIRDHQREGEDIRAEMQRQIDSAERRRADEAQRKCDARNEAEALRKGIENALAHLEKGRYETRETRCAKALRALAEEHQIGVEECPF